MAIHPDDPPRPIFGLPRIMSDEEDMRRMIREVPAMHCGFTLCTGSLGGLYSNSPHLLMEEFADRVYFAHFRNTVFDADHESFRESDSHLCGHTDMAYAMPVPHQRGKPPEGGRPGKLAHSRAPGSRQADGHRPGKEMLRRVFLRRPRHRPGGTPRIGHGPAILPPAGREKRPGHRGRRGSLLRHGPRPAEGRGQGGPAGPHRSKLEELQRKLAEEGLTRTLVIAADVLDKAQLEEAATLLENTWGRLDILVNGAGGNDPRGTTPAEQCMPDTPVEQGFFGMDMQGFEYVNRLNMIGTILPSQVFGKLLAASSGCIVNISSMAAFLPLTKVGAYGAAKAAVDNFTKWLATHLAPLGVRVNAIAPGFFITDQNRFLMMEKDGETPTPRGRKVLAKTPMHRFGEPGDLCGALQFLVSPSASFVTGTIIPVDGGFLAYSGV